MRVAATVVLVLASLAMVSAQPVGATCASAAECTRLAEAAIARAAFEEAHDFAWRAMQQSRNDPRVMWLLARTQSLSGRPHDALVMLRRLTTANVPLDTVETSDEFRRVRALSTWPQLRDVLKGATPDTVAAPVSVAPAPAHEPSVSAPPPSPTPPAAPAVPAPPPPAEAAGKAGLALPARIIAPTALAYDAVSRRYVVVDESSDTLKVIDELNGNAVDLVSRGWANGYRPTALAIDTRRGDLWVAGVQNHGGDSAQSALLKLQLVSGRLLDTIPLPDDTTVRIVGLAVGRNGVWALDAAGKRLFLVTASGRPRQTTLSLDGTPIGITVAPDDTAYVAHENGIVRVDAATRRATPLTAAAAITLAGMQSLAWHDRRLFGVQRGASGSQAAVRLRLDARGARVTALDTIEPAATPAAAIYGGQLHFIAPGEGDSLVFRHTTAK
jgi:hypothetical protein